MFASQQNITTRHNMSQTCHMRHIVMLDDQTIKKILVLLNTTFQSHPIRMGCCTTNEKSLIVTTINPIWRSRPVHPGKKFTICTLKSKENIIFAHNFLLKQNINQATCCLDFQSSIFFLSLGLDTLFQLQSILTLIVQTIVSAV